jgi:hypothetical protein
LQFLDGTTNEDETVKFLSPTEWPSPVTWPVCLEIVESCTVLPDSLDNTFTNLTSLPVDVGETVTYSCEEKGKMISLIKPTKFIFGTTFTLIILTYALVKSTTKIFSNIVAFSENPNFIKDKKKIEMIFAKNFVRNYEKK